VNFDLSDEQKILGEQVHNVLAELGSFDQLRRLIENNAEYDGVLWEKLSGLGAPGVVIPEAYGGLGLSALELGVINQELGRANAAIPYFSSIVLAAEALSRWGSEEQKKAHLPGLATGERIACFAHAEGPGRRELQTHWRDGRISGIKTPVPDAGVAQIAIVECQQGLALVDLGQAGVRRTRLESFDQLRPHYRIEFVEATAELLTAEACVDTLFDLAATQAAFEAIGGAEACLYMARDYAAQRVIFGRKLASYQAIKHKLADILTAIELARSNAYFAAWAASGSPAELPAAAAAARLSASVAFESAARENLHVHGGIGYTFEANCHFYYRRERTLAASLGGRHHWAERLLSHDTAHSQQVA